MTKVWLVVKVWPTGRQEWHEAYFDEDRARWSAAQLVGIDSCSIALQTVDVIDSQAPDAETVARAVDRAKRTNPRE